MSTHTPDLPISEPMIISDKIQSVKHQVVGLFAGVGGLELGLQRAGHSTRLLCEIDPGARSVLETHPEFDSVSLKPDVCKLNRTALQESSLMTAGFPCQDLSQAGKTKGLKGKNSGLIHEVFRLLRSRRIPEVLLENVPFMMRLGNGSVLDTILKMFEDLDYSWAYRVIDAQAFGIPQRRQRIFILASRIRDPRTVLLSGKSFTPSPPSEWVEGSDSMGFYWTEGNTGVGWAINSTPTLKGGSALGIPSPPAILLPDGEVVTPTIEGAERLQGFRAHWTRPSIKIQRASHRWKLVGNAINVRVARWIGDRLAEPKIFKSRHYRPLKSREKWPICAWCIDGSSRWTDDEITPFPVQRSCPPIHDFLGDQVQPLSKKALMGFTSRLKKSSLNTPEDFIPALDHAIKQIQLAHSD